MAYAVAILHGALEGNWHSKKMRHYLRQRGYKVVDDVQHADILITHSGGCLLVPETHSYKIILLINPTYWPGKRPRNQTLAKLWGDMRFYLFSRPIYYFQKNAANLYYLVSDAPRLKLLLDFAKQFNMPNDLPDYKGSLILVRNRTDPWCTPDLRALKSKYPTLHVHSLPADHDDCWQNPKPYVDLLQLLDELRR